MIEYYKKTVRQKKLERVEDYTRGCWVKVINPNSTEIDFLVDKFKLDKDLLFDGLDVYEIPRIEEEGSKAYIYLTMPTSKIPNEYTSSFLIIVSKNLLITVSKSNLELFDKIVSTRKDFLTNNQTRSLLQILLFLSNSYAADIRKIMKEVKKDRRNIKKLNDKDILDLVLQEDRLNEYLSSFSPLINLHATMLKLKSVSFKEDEKEFIEDLIVDLNQTLSSCKSALKTISNMRDYYSTTLSHNLNKILGVLTIFTVFLTIPAVISGIYGMNIKLPLQNVKSAFWILGGIVLMIWVIAIIGLKRAKVI
ncbi:magnesium transporter CorA family protein [Candidatus Pacearchaeota archaeon]|nr:magnesium transporter CorA family protein [Candidatus Pacearchaeota archaeon]